MVVLGDESGYLDGENQKMKVASIEAEWKTEPPPASFTAFGLPDVAARKTRAAIKIPWALGLIATRSIDRPVLGIFDREKAKGVEFTSPPTERFYGIEALLKDNSGNWFSMTQRKK